MAQRVLGIDIGHTEIKAVLAEVTWRATTLLGVYVEPVPSQEQVAHRLPPADLETDADTDTDADDDPGETGNPGAPIPPWVYAIGDLLKKHNLEYNEVHVVLPGSAATSRILTLPFNNRRRLDAILPFELEPLVPFDLDEMHLAFDVLGKDPAGGYRILVAMTPQTELARFLGHLAEAGIDPRIVDVAPYNLYTAAKMALADQFGSFAVIDLGSTHTDVAVLSEGELVDLRSIALGGNRFNDALAKALKITAEEAEAVKIDKVDLAGDSAESAALVAQLGPWVGRLRQTLQGVRAEKGLDITRVYLTGRGGLMMGIADFLGRQLDVEVERLPLAPGDAPVTLDVADPLDQARYATALTLVNRGLGELRDIKLNLRHGPFIHSRQKVALQANLRSIAVVGGIVLALLLYNVIANQMQKRRHHEALQDQVVQLYMKAFPSAAPPVRPLDQFRGQISKTVAKHQIVGFLGDANLRAIEIIKIISEQMPPGVVLDIKKFDLAPDAIKIEGEVPSFPDVDKVEEALKKFSGFKSVKKETSSTVSNEAVKYKFHVGLIEKSKTTGKKKTMSGAAMPTPGGTP
jgi:general secretion pathway protein L